MYGLFLQAQQSSSYSTFILVGVMVLILYLFMIRPQQKRMRSQKKYLAALQEGDTVVTVGGIHGTVVSLNENDIVIAVDKGIKLTLERNSISYEASKRRG